MVELGVSAISAIMETSVDKADGQVLYSRTQQLVDMVFSRFHIDDVESKRRRRQWCLNVIIVYLILLTAVTIFLLYKVSTLEPSTSASSTERLTSSNHIPLGGEQGAVNLPTLIHNNVWETEMLKDSLGALKNQFNSLCGEEGLRLRANLILLNTSTHMLEDKLTSVINLSQGVQGPPGRNGAKGEKGDTGIQGPTGPAGSSGSTGYRGSQGPRGDKGDRGPTGGWNLRLAGFLAEWRGRGRIELQINGVWGTVCDDSFDTFDGTVICTMLGYARATEAYTAGGGSGRIWLDDLECSGSESSVYDCPHNGLGSHNCNHGEDAGVQCV